MPAMLDDSFVQEAVRAMYLDGERQAPPITAHELRLKDNRSHLRVGLKLPVVVAAAVVLIVVLFAVPLRHHVRPSASTPSGHIPNGWSAYSAYGLQISVPDTWRVNYFPGCSYAERPGILTIGQSDLAYSCPAFAGHGALVSVYEVSARQAGMSTPRAISVNDVHVLAGTFDGTTTWYVPSAHVYVSGRGPGSAGVLQTLDKAMPDASKAPGVGKGTAYLEALVQVPTSGTATVRNLASGRTATVQFANGQFSFEGPPGHYTVTVSSGNAACAPISASISSGTYTTWPPVRCQGA